MKKTLEISLGVFNRTLAASEALTIGGSTRLFEMLDGEVWKTSTLSIFVSP